MLGRGSIIAFAMAGYMATAALPVHAAEDKDDKAASVLSHIPKEIIPCQPHDKNQEDADQALLEKAMKRANAHDLAGLDQMMPDIQAALARAPNKPSLPEKCDGKLYIYSVDMMDMLMSVGIAKEVGVTTTIQMAPLPYARLYFIAGWLAVERQDADAAADYFIKGLLNAPHDTVLASEYANLLATTGRSDQALIFTNTYIDENPGLEDKPMALMLRRRGYALGELGRYDEAIAAYKESLKLDADNKTALNEIDYNKQQRALHKN